MRSLFILTILFAAVAGVSAAREQSIDDLKSHARNAQPQDRPGLCMQIAEHQLRNADKLYRDGDSEQAHLAIDDIIAYSEQARESAVATKKHLKNVEISVRKIAEKLRDVKRSVSIEDQPVVQHAVERLEDIRTTLLKQMFSKEKK
jgi:hypothetical protein